MVDVATCFEKNVLYEMQNCLICIKYVKRWKVQYFPDESKMDDGLKLKGSIQDDVFCLLLRHSFKGSQAVTLGVHGE